MLWLAAARIRGRWRLVCSGAVAAVKSATVTELAAVAETFAAAEPAASAASAAAAETAMALESAGVALAAVNRRTDTRLAGASFALVVGRRRRAWSPGWRQTRRLGEVGGSGKVGGSGGGVGVGGGDGGGGGGVGDGGVGVGARSRIFGAGYGLRGMFQVHEVSSRRLAIVQHRHHPARGLLSLISLLRAFLLTGIKWSGRHGGPCSGRHGWDLAQFLRGHRRRRWTPARGGWQ